MNVGRAVNVGLYVNSCRGVNVGAASGMAAPAAAGLARLAATPLLGARSPHPARPRPTDGFTGPLHARYSSVTPLPMGNSSPTCYEILHFGYDAADSLGIYSGGKPVYTLVSSKRRRAIVGALQPLTRHERVRPARS